MALGSGFPGSGSKESACNERDLGSIPGSGKSLAGGNGNPLQYFCLEKSHGQGEPSGLQSMGHKESGRVLETKHAHEL